MEEALQRLEHQIDSGGIKDPKKIQRKIGKLQERNKRSARFFRITLSEDQGRAKLSWDIDQQKLGQAELLDGCYTLKTDRGDVEEDTFLPTTCCTQPSRCCRPRTTTVPGQRSRESWTPTG